jgi:hypothetical protein
MGVKFNETIEYKVKVQKLMIFMYLFSIRKNDGKNSLPLHTKTLRYLGIPSNNKNNQKTLKTKQWVVLGYIRNQHGI